MKLSAALLFSIILPLLGNVAATRPPFRSALHVFQQFSAILYPSSPPKQRAAVLTLSYLFRPATFSKREHLHVVHDYIRTGGLSDRPRSRDIVLPAEVSNHLHEGTLVQDVGVLRPSVDILIKRHQREAERVWKVYHGRGDPMREPPNLGFKERLGGIDLEFRAYPKPMTIEEAERMVGDGWKRAGSRRGDQKRLYWGWFQAEDGKRNK